MKKIFSNFVCFSESPNFQFNMISDSSKTGAGCEYVQVLELIYILNLDLLHDIPLPLHKMKNAL